MSENLGVVKTVKLFIGGKFPRTESGRTFPVHFHKTKKLYGHMCLASRKDFRSCVDAAKGALSGWSARDAYNRGQILYRMAEMMEGKRIEFVQTLTQTLGYTEDKANKAVTESIDGFVYFAGFTDKIQQVYGSVNPVSGPHHNFTTAEPTGIVTHIPNEKFDLPKLVREISAIICSGNTVITLMHKEGAAVLAPLAEVFATSDLPGGVVNLISGNLEELNTHIGGHMEVQAISFQSDNDEALTEINKLAAENMKRVLFGGDSELGLKPILNFVEYKTVWHPIGV